MSKDIEPSIEIHLMREATRQILEISRTERQQVERLVQSIQATSRMALGERVYRR